MKYYIVLKNILNFVAKLNSLVCFLLLLNVIFMKRKIKGNENKQTKTQKSQ